MPHGEHLAEERAVGVSVQIDPLDAERGHDVGEVVGGVGRAVVDRGGAQLPAARAGVDHVVAHVGLQRRAVDRPRVPRAPVVDQ